MKPRFKNGLIAGLAGLTVGTCLTFGASGLCGPVVAILVGALAGHFTAREERPATRYEATRLGTISGGIAGALMLLTGGLNVLSLPARIQALPVPPEAELSQVIYFISLSASALVAAIGLALTSALLAALAGAAAGYVHAVLPPVHAENSASATKPGLTGIVAPLSLGASVPQQSAVWRQGLRFGLIVGGALSLVISFAVLTNGGAASNWGVWLFATAAYCVLAVGLFTLVGIAVVWIWRLLGRTLGRVLRR